MVKICRGEKVLTVTKGAFDSYFKRKGWSIADKDKPSVPEHTSTEPVVETVHEEVEDELDESEELETEDEEAETPISEMTIREMRAYAEEHEINLDGKNKAGEIRETILKSIEKED